MQNSTVSGLRLRCPGRESFRNWGSHPCCATHKLLALTQLKALVPHGPSAEGPERRVQKVAAARSSVVSESLVDFSFRRACSKGLA